MGPVRRSGLAIFAALLTLSACSEPPAVVLGDPTPSQAATADPSPSPSLQPSRVESPSSQAPPGPEDRELAGPSFAGSASPIDRSRLPYSWREGCPVEVHDLRLLTLAHWGFDGRVHTGELIVHRDQATKVISAMRKLFEQGFPIEKMALIDLYEGDDDRSMDANNTSAFNCREVQGRPGVWSQHSYGRAIDINPIQNPYVSSSGEVSPAAGAAYADRSKKSPGMIRSGDAVVKAFASVGWKWGGYWSRAKDYQHFSSNGR